MLGWIASSLFWGPTPGGRRSSAARRSGRGLRGPPAERGRPPAARRPPRDGGPLRRGAGADRDCRRGLRGARPDAQLRRLASRRDGRAARRRPRRGGTVASARATPRWRRWARRWCSPRRPRSWARRCWRRGAYDEAARCAELSAEHGAPGRHASPRACGAGPGVRCFRARRAGGCRALRPRGGRVRRAHGRLTNTRRTPTSCWERAASGRAYDAQAARVELRARSSCTSSKGNRSGPIGPRPACSARPRLRRSH